MFVSTDKTDYYIFDSHRTDYIIMIIRYLLSYYPVQKFMSVFFNGARSTYIPNFVFPLPLPLIEQTEARRPTADVRG